MNSGDRQGKDLDERLTSRAAGALEVEPPVVARLVIEIRSDGSRTIARGALEDSEHGERVAMEARGDTPLALAASLLRSLAEAPLLAASLARSKQLPEGNAKPRGSLRRAAQALIDRRRKR